MKLHNDVKHLSRKLPISDLKCRKIKISIKIIIQDDKKYNRWDTSSCGFLSNEKRDDFNPSWQNI